VHNKFVVDDLRQRGAIFVDELDEVPDDNIVIFSAHGVSKAVQIEPITEDVVAKIIAQEKVDAVLPTMGGQTALNIAMKMYEKGMLEGIKFLGANPEAIKKGEDRQAFKEAMIKIGMDIPKSKYGIRKP
jgi:carbamoyl-phosphate synthase large subunit